LQDLRLWHLHLDPLREELVALDEPRWRVARPTRSTPLEDAIASNTRPSGLDAEMTSQAPTAPSSPEGVERGGEELGVDAGQLAQVDRDAPHRRGPSGVGVRVHLIEESLDERIRALQTSKRGARLAKAMPSANSGPLHFDQIL
jgi:hypothetical protein